VNGETEGDIRPARLFNDRIQAIEGSCAASGLWREHSTFFAELSGCAIDNDPVSALPCRTHVNAPSSRYLTIQRYPGQVIASDVIHDVMNGVDDCIRPVELNRVVAIRYDDLFPARRKTG
jgi:hypothetical protein